ncbi:transposase [Neorhizobium galegae]|nr:transposase [Neorhizobium galegae]
MVWHVGRDGRRRYDPASIDRLLAACLEPGVSVSRLVLEQGVNANLVRKWIKRPSRFGLGLWLRPSFRFSSLRMEICRCSGLAGIRTPLLTMIR